MATILLVNPDPAAVKLGLKQQLAVAEVDLNSPDLLMIGSDSKIGVETSKQIQQFFSLKPYQLKLRAVVIEDATTISEVVQSSLLKTIEELPNDRMFLLGASHTHGFLPTLLSRIQVETAASINSEVLSNTEIAKIEAILGQNAAERFSSIEKIKEKSEFLKQLMKYFHQRYSSQASIGPIGQTLLEAERWIGANVNSRAVLEYLMLSLPKIS